MLQPESAWDTINELGRLDRLHFVDLNNDKLFHDQTYAKQIRRIEETEKRME
jgi:hypothetical protein